MSLITFRAHYQVLDIRFSHNKNSECSSIIHKIELWRKERHWIYFIATYFEILKKEKRGYLITLQIHSQLFLLFSFKTDYIKHLIFFFFLIIILLVCEELIPKLMICPWSFPPSVLS